MADEAHETALSMVTESLVAALVEALNNDGLTGCESLALAKDVFQTGDDPCQIMAALQTSLKGTEYVVSEEAEVITISDSRTSEKLKLEMIFGGSEGSEVTSAYLEDIPPTAEQRATAREMVGKFTGGCDLGEEDLVPADTELSILESGLLSGSYAWHSRTHPPESGCLQQVDVIIERHALFRLNDGKGFLSAAFNEDFSEFDGVFFQCTEEPDEGQMWNGRRRVK